MRKLIAPSLFLLLLSIVAAYSNQAWIAEVGALEALKRFGFVFIMFNIVWLIIFSTVGGKGNG